MYMYDVASVLRVVPSSQELPWHGVAGSCCSPLLRNKYTYQQPKIVRFFHFFISIHELNIYLRGWTLKRQMIHIIPCGYSTFFIRFVACIYNSVNIFVMFFFSFDKNTEEEKNYFPKRNWVLRCVLAVRCTISIYSCILCVCLYELLLLLIYSFRMGNTRVCSSVTSSALFLCESVYMHEKYILEDSERKRER